MRGAVAAVAVALLLGGCTTLVEGSAATAPTPAPGDDPLFEAPPVGTCHDVETTYLPLDVPPVVDCGDHSGETAVVLDTGLPLDAAYPTEDDLEVGYLGAAFDDVCGYEVPQEYLRAELADLLYVSTAQVLPTPEQWAAGARWVACDVTYGYDSPEPVPGRMAGAMDSGDTSPFRRCLDGDPVDYDQVPCSEPHWAEEITGLPDVADGTPFPADRAARAAIAAQCLPAAVDYLDGPMPAEVVVDVTTDDAEDWASFPFPTCVLVPTAGGETSTSVRDA